MAEKIRKAHETDKKISTRRNLQTRKTRTWQTYFFCFANRRCILNFDRARNNAKQKRQINNLKESVFGRAACRWNMQIRPWTSADKAAARPNGGENPARSTECGTWQWFVSILS